MILATGATGTAGSQVVRALQERGVRVRAFVRDPKKARERLGDVVELAVGDFDDPSSVRAALDGTEALVLSCSDDPRRVEWETAAIDSAAAAGVQRIVKLSTIGAEPGAPVAFWDWHGQVEHYLLSSEVPAVILQSSFYMSNLFALAEPIVREGLLPAPAGGAKIAMIDPRDVGNAAASVVTGAAHDGTTYVITGPEAITYEEAAAELTVVTGKHVAFVDIPDDAARKGMIEAGLPEFVADEVVKVHEMLRRGIAERVTSTVEELTGVPPRGFAAFARDHAQIFESTTLSAAET